MDPVPVTFVRDERGGVLVYRDGHQQSYVDVADPTNLAFEYVAQMGLALDALAPATPQPLAVTHVGGAGLTLARYVAHTRPGSPQIVLEPDESTTAAVRRELPLPRGHRIRVRAVDGATGVRALASASAEAVLLDAYAAGRVPPELGTVEFLTEVARVLDRCGLLVANLADAPDRRYLVRVAAGCVAAGLPNLAVLATHDILKGRRFGNSVLVASPTAYDVGALRRAAARCPIPTGVRAERELASWLRSARPFTAADAEPSPQPPIPSAWRAT
ncbi:MAG: fused MFS/spermidine synthase [Actinobacteria bacterium]|nr:fused MFS/spermidine synthase [Actinomycetota bacterium]